MESRIVEQNKLNGLSYIGSSSKKKKKTFLSSNWCLLWAYEYSVMVNCRIEWIFASHFIDLQSPQCFDIISSTQSNDESSRFSQIVSFICWLRSIFIEFLDKIELSLFHLVICQPSTCSMKPFERKGLPLIYYAFSRGLYAFGKQLHSSFDDE